MKKLRNFAILLTAILTISSASAVIINISNIGGALTNGVAKGTIGGGGDPTSIFNYLNGSVIPGYNGIPGPSAPLPFAAPALVTNYGSVSGNGTDNKVDITGFQYAAIHYGGGKGGGMFVFYYLNGMSGEHTFEANGGLVGDGTGVPYSGKDVGTGGISNIRLYGKGTSVPDSGSTLIFLGLGLGLLGFIKRRK